MRTRVMTLAMLALLPAAAWAAPVDQGALDRCIARNTLRFTQPGDALAAQYVDIAAACRAALAGNTVGHIAVTGGGTAGGASASTSSTAPARTTQSVGTRRDPHAAATTRAIATTLARDSADPAGPVAGLTALPWQYWLGIAVGVVVAAALVFRGRRRRTTDTT